MAKVYVEPDAMSSWKSSMDKINSDCIKSIDEIDSALGSLNSSFQGDYETKYEESFKSLIKTVKSSHEALKDFGTFLDKIVAIMENQ